MKRIMGYVVLLAAFACNNDKSEPARDQGEAKKQSLKNARTGKKHFEGAISNGMKGDKISFDISADGTTLENLTFDGYWRCSGTLEQTTAGPEGSFPIEEGKVSGHISEPPNGGSTAWRFDLEASINGDEATGTFRMNINNLGCDTYKLNWTASAKR